METISIARLKFNIVNWSGDAVIIKLSLYHVSPEEYTENIGDPVNLEASFTAQYFQTLSIYDILRDILMHIAELLDLPIITVGYCSVSGNLGILLRLRGELAPALNQLRIL